MRNSKAKHTRKSTRKVTIESTGKNLTIHAGLVPVMRFLGKLGFSKAFHRTVEHRRAHNARYQLSDAVELNVLSLIAGARSVDESIRVWADNVLRKLGGWDNIMNATTMGRILKTVTEQHIYQMETFNHIMRGRVWKRARALTSSLMRGSMWIDVDSTVKTTYGKHQEGAAVGYNPHKRGAPSYHPQLAFCAETKEILQAWLRCGNAYTSNGIVAFMKQLAAHLPNRMRLVFRGDSGYFVGALLDWLDARGDGYLIKVKLKGLVGLLEIQQWQAVAGHDGWEQASFTHRCGTWAHTRTFVAVRRLKDEDCNQGKLLDMRSYDYFCYVTTENLTPWQTHKKYGERATCETWIDEAKNQMGMAHIKTKNFLASSALFQCAVLAYNTVRWMALVSGDKQLMRWEMASIRTFMVRMAGKLVCGGRQMTLKIPTTLLHPKPWQSWLRVGMT
ncbi:MAG: IS1380 family transposase [Ghiorsea sp.]|nr:IS1380 family transposase [Ghiorsea sp.]